MIQFYKTLFHCSAAMSVISLVYMASMPLLSKRYTAKWRYYIWLVIVLGWIIPYRPQFIIPLIPAKTPAIHTVQFLPAKYITAIENLKALPIETAAAPSIDPGWPVFMIWFMGLVGILLYHTVRHVRFMKFVNRWSQDVVDLETINILDTLKSEMKIKTQVGLKTCTGIASPMMTGVYRQVIFLPSGNIPKDDLIFILRHELVHLRRNDLWYKAFVLLAAALHWFNPVVYIMAKTIARQCEISCDEEVLQGMNFEERRHYGEIIIGVVRNKVKLKTALSTNFCGGKKSMKTRIFSIMDTTKKKAGVIVLGIVFIATIGTGVAAGEIKEQSISVPTSAGEAERPPYSDMEKKSRQEYLSDLGFLDYDTDEHVYRYNGKWVRTINDKYTWNGKPYGGVSRSDAPENYFSGEPVDVKVVRNQDTNQIEKLVEMTEAQTQQVLKAEFSIPSGEAATSQIP